MKGMGMKFYPIKNNIFIQSIGLSLFLSITVFIPKVYAIDDIQFNTDVLDVNDKNNIDLSQFSRTGYIMPGIYDMKIYVNKDSIPEQQIPYYIPNNESNGSRACVNKKLVEQLGFKEEIIKKLTWWHQGECVEESSVKGVEIRGDLSTSSLYLNIPHAYLEYIDDNWESPSRWDDGISGLVFDYNMNARVQHQQSDDYRNYSVSGNGAVNVIFKAVHSADQCACLFRTVQGNFQCAHFFTGRHCFRRSGGFNGSAGGNFITCCG